jgi:pimeloyl-ACP methyl ester carboxylesterase
MAKKLASELEGSTDEGVLRDVTARGIRTRVLQAGEPTAPAVLLVHGFHASHRTFEDLVPALADAFHVLVPDLPGFGASEKPNPARYAYGVETYAEALADLIAAFAVGRASVVGHGMGAAIALTLAAEHPELVQRLILEDALCYPAPSPLMSRLLLFPIVGTLVFKQLYGRNLFRAYYRDFVYKKGFTIPMERVDWHYDAFNSPPARESAYAVLRATLDTRAIVARLTRVVAPTLVTWGRHDRLYPVGGAHRLVRTIPNARLQILDAGHSPHEEHPRAFLVLTREFLEGRRSA